MLVPNADADAKVDDLKSKSKPKGDAHAQVPPTEGLKLILKEDQAVLEAVAPAEEIERLRIESEQLAKLSEEELALQSSES